MDDVTNPPEDLPRITAALTYDDVAAAVDWLVAVFGFREREATRITADDGTVVHAELELGDDGLIMLGGPFSDRASPRTRGGTTCMLNAYVQDVAAHLEHARAAGATILAELDDTFYGDRTYRASDLEGHHWMFAQRVRDVPPEEWDWGG